MPNQPSPEAADRSHWTVIVRDDRVFRRYRTDGESSHERDVMEVDLCGGNVDVYAVDPGQDAPPEEGEQVDPAARGWTSISARTCTSPHSEQA